MKKLGYLLLISCANITAFAQDNLINSLKNNASQKANFQFKTIKDVENTSVKNQGHSGTCWSYSGNSFLESEMIRMGKKPVDIAEIFTARNVYTDKAKNFVLNSGAISWGDGGELHDVTNMLKKYGAVPQSAYSGLINGAVTNDFTAMQQEIKSKLDSLVKITDHKLSTDWQTIVPTILDKYLGKVPSQFTYEGKTYTPQTFAKEVVGINADDYVEISSYADYPYYTQFVIPIPDNWSHDRVYNVPMTELTEIIDNALLKGYSVGWATDVSEPYFSYKNGVAYVPDLDLDQLTTKQKASIFNASQPDKIITEQMRQQALNTLETTDDHGMQIVGVAKDQTGKEYYKVKNSWGTTNDFGGYLYVSKPYVQYKSTAILLHKKGLPSQTKKKLKL